MFADIMRRRLLPKPCGSVQLFRCPYHGWSYGLDGSLKGTPDFAGVCNFDRAENGLVPIAVDSWEQFVFVSIDPRQSLREYLGSMVSQVAPLGIGLAPVFRIAHLYPELQLEGVRRQLSRRRISRTVPA